MVIVLKCGASLSFGSFLHIIFIGTPQFPAPLRQDDPRIPSSLALIEQSYQDIGERPCHGWNFYFDARRKLTIRYWNQVDGRGWDRYTGTPLEPLSFKRDLP